MVLCRMSRIPRHGGMGDRVELVHADLAKDSAIESQESTQEKSSRD